MKHLDPKWDLSHLLYKGASTLIYNRSQTGNFDKKKIKKIEAFLVPIVLRSNNNCDDYFHETPQELRTLSSVTLDCQVTMMSWSQFLNCQIEVTSL